MLYKWATRHSIQISKYNADILAGMAYNLHIDPSNRRYKLSGINVVPPRSYIYTRYIRVIRYVCGYNICLRLTARRAQSQRIPHIKYWHVNCGRARLKRKQTKEDLYDISSRSFKLNIFQRHQCKIAHIQMGPFFWNRIYFIHIYGTGHCVREYGCAVCMCDVLLSDLSPLLLAAPFYMHRTTTSLYEVAVTIATAI